MLSNIIEELSRSLTITECSSSRPKEWDDYYPRFTNVENTIKYIFKFKPLVSAKVGIQWCF